MWLYRTTSRAKICWHDVPAKNIIVINVWKWKNPGSYSDHPSSVSAVKPVGCRLPSSPVRLRYLSSSFSLDYWGSVLYRTAHRTTCTEPCPGLLTSRDKGPRRCGHRKPGPDKTACCPATHLAMESVWSRRDACWRAQSFFRRHILELGLGIWRPTMSAREKGIPTKDSVSLLPCFYFVEVGRCCMLLSNNPPAQWGWSLVYSYHQRSISEKMGCLWRPAECDCYCVSM